MDAQERATEAAWRDVQTHLAPLLERAPDLGPVLARYLSRLVQLTWAAACRSLRDTGHEQAALQLEAAWAVVEHGFAPGRTSRGGDA